MKVYVPQRLHWLTPVKRMSACESDDKIHGFIFELDFSMAKSYLKKVKSEGYTILKNQRNLGTFRVA